METRKKRPYLAGKAATLEVANGAQKLQFGGKENVISVKLSPEDQSSRWYPGAGICRNVWLHSTDAVHAAHWGTCVTTPKVSAAAATVAVRTELRNRGAEPAHIELETAIVDAAGTQVARTASALTPPVAPGALPEKPCA